MTHHQRRAAALEALAHALLELAAIEREVDGASPQVEPARREPAEAEQPLPPGMTAWVSPDDVARAVGCSKAKAHEYVRAAAGRSVGTGRLLRVPVDVWEAWARENLLPDGQRRESSLHMHAPARALSTKRRRQLGPSEWGESKHPLIPMLQPRKP